MTPIIAGTISGTCIGVAWLIALIVILLKRYRRKKYYKEVGKPDKDAELNDKGEFIVPPDPAILEGSHMPGERVIIEKKQRWWKFRHRGNPKSRIEEKGKGKEVAPTEMVPVPSPGPSSEPADDCSSQNTSTQNYQTELLSEERDHRSPPPLNRLATIMSVPEAPSVPELANGDAGEREDVKDVDFATSDNSPTPPNADPNNTQIHFYPPSTS